MASDSLLDIPVVTLDSDGLCALMLWEENESYSWLWRENKQLFYLMKICQIMFHKDSMSLALKIVEE